jgi:hypothetical protein
LTHSEKDHPSIPMGQYGIVNYGFGGHKHSNTRRSQTVQLTPSNSPRRFASRILKPRECRYSSRWLLPRPPQEPYLHQRQRQD